MTIRRIPSYPRREILSRSVSTLASQAEPVEHFDDGLLDLVNDLLETMNRYPICVGLAAPQVGDPRSVAVVRRDVVARSEDLVLVNPYIESTTGQRDIKYESCMSLVGFRGKVERRKKCAVRFVDVFGDPGFLAVEGFAARVVMHEVDHLGGRMYCDQLSGPLEETDLYKEYVEQAKTDGEERS